MEKKLKELFGSVRFWIIVLTTIVAVLSDVEAGASLSEVLNNVVNGLIAVVGIGSADKIVTTLASKNK